MTVKNVVKKPTGIIAKSHGNSRNTLKCFHKSVCMKKCESTKEDEIYTYTMHFTLISAYFIYGVEGVKIWHKST